MSSTALAHARTAIRTRHSRLGPDSSAPLRPVQRQELDVGVARSAKTSKWKSIWAISFLMPQISIPPKAIAKNTATDKRGAWSIKGQPPASAVSLPIARGIARLSPGSAFIGGGLGMLRYSWVRKPGDLLRFSAMAAPSTHAPLTLFVAGGSALSGRELRELLRQNVLGPANNS